MARRTMKTSAALAAAISMARQRAQGSGEDWAVVEHEERWDYCPRAEVGRARVSYVAQPDGELLGVRSDGLWSAMRRAGADDWTPSHATYPSGSRSA